MAGKKRYRVAPLLNKNVVFSILKGRIPGQLVIQYTDACNAMCPQCGMRKTEKFQRSKLPREALCRIIDAAAEKKIHALSFTGGEPFLYKDELLGLIRYASDRKIPLIRTGTNGYLFANWRRPEYVYEIHDLAERLAKTSLRNLWISIDSADEKSHEEMRGLPGVIKGIEIALPIFHEYGIYPAANLGINRNIGGIGKLPMKMEDPIVFYEDYKKAFSEFYRFVIDLGFTMTNTCYPMSSEHKEGEHAVYGAISDHQIVSYSEREKIEVFKALKDVIPKFRSQIRIFTPLSSLFALIRQYEGDLDFPKPCRGGRDFFYIDASEGKTYPCGYRSTEHLGRFADLEQNRDDGAPACKACDWECFRDPSEQVGFLMDLLKHPWKTVKAADPEYFKLWKEDIRYSHRCAYFNGRKAFK